MNFQTRLVTYILLLILFDSTLGLVRFADSGQSKIHQNLRRILNQASNDQLVPVIVIYDDVRLRDRLFTSKIIAKFQGKLKHSYMHLPVIAISLAISEIEELQRHPYVRLIELDDQIPLVSHDVKRAYGVTNAVLQFDLTGDGDGNPSNYSTKDAVIGIIDTGIDATHPALESKVIYWKDFLNHGAIPYDDRGHGTLVSGVAAAAKIENGHSGVAPDAALAIFKAVGSSGTGARSALLAAIDDAIDKKNQLNLKVINMSISTTQPSDGMDSLGLAAQRATENGIVVVAAAGNSGPALRTIGSPAAAPSVIAVGAGGLHQGSFFLADFSSRGPTVDGRIKPDLWAPGIHVNTTMAGGGYRPANGTSIASPFVAGVVALMTHANHNLSVSDVRQILFRTTERWSTKNSNNNESGFGRLQAYEAIALAKGTVADNSPSIPELLKQQIVVGAKEEYRQTIHVVNTRFGISITVINDNRTFLNADLELHDPSGRRVNRVRNQLSRQLTLTYVPKKSGIYQIRFRNHLAVPASFSMFVSANTE